MTKNLLLTVSPTEALNVLNGKQLALLRKRVPKGYVGWCYGVVSKKMSQRMVFKKGKAWYGNILTGTTIVKFASPFESVYGGKIPFRFWYEEVSTYKGFNPHDQVDYIISKEHLQALNTSLVDIWNYASNTGFKDLYAISITKLEVFDKPMEIGEMYTYRNKIIYSGIDCPPYRDEVKERLTKSPSTYQYVWVKE